MIGRNQPCFCGSGFKFKRCCYKFNDIKKKIKSISLEKYIKRFVSTEVSSFTQTIKLVYDCSLKGFLNFIDKKYQDKFSWNKLDKNSLEEFLTLYSRNSNQRLRVLLNTLKHFFGWLQKNQVTNIFTLFRQIYIEKLSLEKTS